MGCELNILRITETLRSKLKNSAQKNLWTLFIDLKSAFDTVSHEILFKKMRDLNISIPLVDTIEWLYKQTAFRVNDKDIQIGAGVIQGGVLSPTLFLIMFNDIL